MRWVRGADRLCLHLHGVRSASPRENGSASEPENRPHHPTRTLSRHIAKRMAVRTNKLGYTQSLKNSRTNPKWVIEKWSQIECQ